MPATYEPIATTTLTTGQTTIDFNSIPGTYTDLCLIVTGTSDLSGRLSLRFNSSSASDYSVTNILGNGSAASSANQTSQTFLNSYSVVFNQDSSLKPGFCKTDIFNYAGSTFKTVLMNTNNDTNGAGNVGNTVGLWRSTNAITSISIYSTNLTGTTYTIGIGTTATLYGIKKA